MRYGYLVKQPDLAFGLPIKKLSRKKEQYDYGESIFRRLLIYDSIPDEDPESVIREAEDTLGIADPAFHFLGRNDYAAFIRNRRHLLRWQKIRQDHNSIIQAETKRRNSENPFYNSASDYRDPQSWSRLPDEGRAYKNRPWQFSDLYKEMHALQAHVSAWLRGNRDADAFRAQVNSILASEKLVFALEGGLNRGEFLGEEGSIVDLKLSLDGFKLAELFLLRTIESLHKLRWNGQSKHIDAMLAVADGVADSISRQAAECERRLLLFLVRDQEQV